MFVFQINQLVDLLNSASISIDKQKSMSYHTLQERLMKLDEFQHWVNQWQFKDTYNASRPVVKRLNFQDMFNTNNCSHKGCSKLFDH
jgi:hypothetical protein